MDLALHNEILESGLKATESSLLVQIPAVQTTVVNTTGAGDAFAAGFIQIWADGGELIEALNNGANLASQCVALVGSRPALD